MTHAAGVTCGTFVVAASASATACTSAVSPRRAGRRRGDHLPGRRECDQLKQRRPRRRLQPARQPCFPIYRLRVKILGSGHRVRLHPACTRCRTGKQDGRRLAGDGPRPLGNDDSPPDLRKLRCVLSNSRVWRVAARGRLRADPRLQHQGREGYFPTMLMPDAYKLGAMASAAWQRSDYTQYL